MNYSIIRYVTGTALKFESLFLCLPLIVALIYRDKCAGAFAAVILASLAIGWLLSFKKPKSYVFYAVEGYICVSLCWIVLSLFGALPFWISGEIPSFVDALFETISGFTTTGASILSNVEGLSHGCMFWRSFTHWIGGMGVLVFILAVFPMRGGNSMFLMKAESPGPSVEKLVPRVKTTAFILYAVYTVMTIIEIVLLFVTGMPFFDAVTLSLGTAGTGGFGIKNDSIAGYAPHMQVIITVFMILFGVNFNAYYLMLRGKFKTAFTEEVKVYLGIILVSGLAIAWNIRHIFPDPLEALRHSFFQVGSVITTTGYSTADFDLWPAFSTTILVTIMFIGACAGSTGGGIKVSRVVILVKSVVRELFTVKHPKGVRTVKLDGHVVDKDTVRSVHVFISSYVLIYMLSLLVVSLDDFDFTTNFTAIVATLNNIGPGLAKVGPAANFGLFSDVSKLVLMLDMLIGRLELMPMLVLFAPVTWKRQ
ncbi:MAG: TrkH family potassium uptake protein [Lachnospiraceae bacterium]|nr:TrkH family potassium uptake protein [Lachnospiraceae bacterium]